MCSTGYRRGAGWTIPVGNLLNAGIMAPVSSNSAIQDDAETVAGFFGQVRPCLPVSEAPAKSSHA